MEASILSKQIENAQKKVEEQNFVMRKNVLKYDDVMNTQRQVIYAQRRAVLEGEDLSDEIRQLDRRGDREAVDAPTRKAEYGEEWDLERAQRRQMQRSLRGPTSHPTSFAKRSKASSATRSSRSSSQDARDAYQDKEAGWPNTETDQPLLRDLERYVTLQVVDHALA